MRRKEIRKSIQQKKVPIIGIASVGLCLTGILWLGHQEDLGGIQAATQAATLEEMLEETLEETATKSVAVTKESPEATSTTDASSASAIESERTTASSATESSKAQTTENSKTTETTVAASKPTTTESSQGNHLLTNKEVQIQLSPAASGSIQYIHDGVSIVEQTPTTSDAATTTSSEQEITIRYSHTTGEFIQLIGTKAQAVASQYDLYASVMIAQAILESASGNSSLAQAPNYNLFGVKGTYEGSGVSFPTQEDNGSGGMYTINATFRKYPSYTESLADYAKLLQSDFYSGARKSQAAAYQEATKYLTGRYATDTSYYQKLNALIKTYQLTDYDGAVVATDLPEEVASLKEVASLASAPLTIDEIDSHSYSISIKMIKGASSQFPKEEAITAQTPVSRVRGTQSPYILGGR